MIVITSPGRQRT